MEYDERGNLFFFFQAEDGIRDVAVTGVQTCALPICDWSAMRLATIFTLSSLAKSITSGAPRPSAMSCRSEERREGKSVDLGGRRIIKKKTKEEYWLQRA